MPTHDPSGDCYGTNMAVFAELERRLIVTASSWSQGGHRRVRIPPDRSSWGRR